MTYPNQDRTESPLIFQDRGKSDAVDRVTEVHALFGDFTNIARLKTWKPPESVRIGPFHCIKRADRRAVS